MPTTTTARLALVLIAIGVIVGVVAATRHSWWAVGAMVLLVLGQLLVLAGGRGRG